LNFNGKKWLKNEPVFREKFVVAVVTFLGTKTSFAFLNLTLLNKLFAYLLQLKGAKFMS
jgi:hypothetical protein